MGLQTLLRMLGHMLATLPLEVAAALWRLIVMLLLLLLLILRMVAEFLEWVCKKKPERPPPKHCCEVPPHIDRKPDPCLYSQFYLMAQGLSVTWDNPDIWLTLPDGTPVESHALQPATKYLVHARIHNASFDPALGTAVRCLYRPYSFNSPDRVPIEVLPDDRARGGTSHCAVAERGCRVPMDYTADSQPALVPTGECSHPADKNPNNNLGQENTQVLGGASGSPLQTGARLFNPTDRTMRARVTVDQYAVPADEVALKLDTRIRHLRRNRPLDSVRNLMVVVDGQGKLRSHGASGPVMTSYTYRGFRQLRRCNERGAQPLDPAWQVTVNGQVIDPAGHVVVELAPRASVDLPLSVTVPPIIPLQAIASGPQCDRDQ